jgi:hypothetical protein
MTKIFIHFSTFRFELLATNYQLPTTSYQLSAITYQLRSFIRSGSFSYGTNPQRPAGPTQVESLLSAMCPVRKGSNLSEDVIKMAG